MKMLDDYKRENVKQIGASIEIPAMDTEMLEAPNGPIGAVGSPQEVGSSRDLAHEATNEDNTAVETGIGHHKATEDAGKEDTFLDASDNLVVYDGKNAGNGGVLNVNELQERSEDINADRQEIGEGLDDGKQIHHLADEVDRLKDLLDQAVWEKQKIARECEEERMELKKEVVKLHMQMKDLTVQQTVVVQGDIRLEKLQFSEISEEERQSHVDDVPLTHIMNQCLELARSALSEKLESEGTVRELHAILYIKEQDIEDLAAMITENAMAYDIVSSYIRDVQESWSQILDDVTEAQLEKDMEIGHLSGRMRTALSTVASVEGFSDVHTMDNLSHLEKVASIMIDNYKMAISDSQEFKQKEIDLVEKVRNLEEKSEEMFGHLEKSKEVADFANGELQKARADLDNERDRCANVREKLSLAVTKGKALVQQRDSLRQSLAERTVEIEKIAGEMEVKSAALEAAQIRITELKEREDEVFLLRDLLSERNMVVDEFKELLQVDMPEEILSLDITERLRWVINERSVLAGITQEYQELKDILLSSEIPEKKLLSDTKSRVIWLKDECSKLKDENTRAKEAAYDRVDQLVAALSVEMLERYSLLGQLEYMSFEHEKVTEGIHQVSLQRDRVMTMLLDASSLSDGYSDVVCRRSLSDMDALIDRCFVNINAQKVDSLHLSDAATAAFQRIQIAFYVTAQDLTLCEKILENDMVGESTKSSLSNELKAAYQELLAMKDEKASVLNDLQRSEEKYAMLREKLSLAVKKGKGLVLERETLKNLLDEKDGEIKRLQINLHQQQSALDELMENNNRLTADAECIPRLESDLFAQSNKNSLLEQLIGQKDNSLQNLIESIDSAALPDVPASEEPIEKIKRLVSRLNDYQSKMEHSEQELQCVREEMHKMNTELAEAETIMRSMKGGLAVHANRLAEEARKIVDKGTLDECKIPNITYFDSCTTRESVVDALSLVEKNLSLLVNEKENAVAGRVAAEADLLMTKEKIAIQASKLEEMDTIVRSLDDVASGLRNDLAYLTQEKKFTENSRASLEDEMKTLKNEISVQVRQLVDTQETISSLKDALSKSEYRIFVLSNEKDNVDAEILTLNSKLNSSLDDLAGTQTALEILKNDITRLVDACYTVLRELQNEVETNKLEMGSFLDLPTDYSNFSENSAIDEKQNINGNKYKNLADKLLSTARSSLTSMRELQNIKITSMKTIEGLQDKLCDNQRRYESAENLQNLCREMGAKLQLYEEREVKFRDGEAELLRKHQELEGNLLTRAETQVLFDKMDGLILSLKDPELDGKLNNLDHLGKLLYLLNNYFHLFHDVRSLLLEKEKLESDLSRRDIEVKQLKEESEVKARYDEQDIEKLRRELSEQTSGLENIIQTFGSNESTSEAKKLKRSEVLTVLGNMCTRIILESENCRLRVRELSDRLSLSQNLNDELSAKIKLLEDSIEGQVGSSEVMRERSIYEAPTVPATIEISEIEDVGTSGKNVTTPTPLVSHVRSMRKGSSDHLALNIDLESSRLLNPYEVDVDKGHMFKSLNATGLIPRQVKTMADKIDGVWVSGGRVLMSRPRTRLGLLVYSLSLHIWLLGSLL